MKYFKRLHVEREEDAIEISKEAARIFLRSAYEREFVDEIIRFEKSFRLVTNYSEFWTKTDDGMIPAPGFYGVCE